MSSTMNLFFPPGATSPEQWRATKANLGTIQSIRDYTQYEQAKGMLRTIEAQLNPDALRTQVTQASEAQYGGKAGLTKLGPENVAKVFAANYQALLKDYQARAQGLKKGIEQFEKYAGTAAPGQPLNVTEPRKREGVVDHALWALGAPARTLSAATGGALESAREQTSDVPIDPTKTETRYPPRARMSPYSPGLKKETVHPQTRVGGVPLSETLARFMRGELDLVDMGKRAVEHAKTGATTAEYQTPEDLSAVLSAAAETYRKQAVDKVLELAAAGKLKTAEEYTQAADKFTADLIAADPAANNPHTVQLLHELVADPLNVVNPLKVVKLLKKVPGVGKGITQIKKGMLKSSKWLRHMPEYDALRLLDSPKSVELLDLLAMSETRADLVSRMGKRMSAQLDVVGQVKNPEYRKLLYDWATTPKETRMPLSSLPTELRPAAQAAEKLETQHKVLGRLTGVHRNFSGGKPGAVLRESREVSGYVPHRVREKAALGDIAAGSGRADLQPSSALERRGTDAPYKKDVYEQWQAELKEFTGQAKAAYEAKQIQRSLKETGYFMELDNPAAQLRKKVKSVKSLRTEKALGEAASATGALRGQLTQALKSGAPAAKITRLENGIKMTEEAIEGAKVAEQAGHAQLEKLAKDTGVEWGVLEGDAAMHDIWGRITGTPLVTELGDKIHMMPKPVIERMRKLTPVIAMQSGDMNEALSHVGQILNKGFAPLNSVFRTNVTLPFPAYHVRNAISAVGLAGAAHGFKVFNPRLQESTFRLTFAAAGLGSKKALKFKYTLPSGEIVDGKRLFEMARQDGILDQFDMLLQAHNTSEGTKVGNLITKAAGKVMEPGRRVGNAIENYQKLIGYVGFLDGTSKSARAKAMRLTNDFMVGYRRMSELDRKIMSEVVPFWAWTRNILGYTVRRMVDSPQRLGLYEKVYRKNEAEWQEKFPRQQRGEPFSMRGLAYTAPLRLQPKAIQEYVKTGKVPEPGHEEYVKMMVDNPLTMGLMIAKDVESLFGRRGTRETRERLIMNLGPVTKSLMDLVLGFDVVNGEAIPEILGTGKESVTGRFAQSYTQRPVTTLNSLFRLFAENNRPADLVDLQAKLAVRNAWQGLDIIFNHLTGQGDKSLPRTIPGISLRLVNPRREESRAIREGAKQLKSSIYDALSNERMHVQLPYLLEEVE